MLIQKPTVLDAARIAAEINLMKSAVIECAYANIAFNTIILAMRRPDISLKYSLESRYAYMAVSDILPENLKKLSIPLAGCTIIGATQIAGDRIVAVALEKEDRLGRKRNLRLIFEIIPKIGNVCLLDESGVIKWSLKKREVDHYSPPRPLTKPTVLNLGSIEHGAAEHPGKELADIIYGLNARDIKNLNLESLGATEAVEAIKYYVSDAVKPGPAWLVRSDDEVAGYSLVRPLLDPGEKADEHDSALRMYEAYYTLATEKTSAWERLETLNAILSREITRVAKKQAFIKMELEKAQSADEFKLCGDLIIANIASVGRGTRHIRLENFEGQLPQYLDIELDPSKSASANAEEYFRKYKKALSSTKVLSRRLDAVKEDLRNLESIKSESGNDADRLEQILRRLKLLSESTVRKARKVVPPRQPFKRFFASNGWEILVGRTNADNDELTFKIANKDDYWFHAWQAAGSHTVLRLPNRQAIPDKRTLLEAASLAAHFSKARTSSKVPVAYTQVKFVRKPKHFPPGKVIVEKEKQLMVKPADPAQFSKPDV